MQCDCVLCVCALYIYSPSYTPRTCTCNISIVHSGIKQSRKPRYTSIHTYTMEVLLYIVVKRIIRKYTLTLEPDPTDLPSIDDIIKSITRTDENGIIVEITNVSRMFQVSECVPHDVCVLQYYKRKMLHCVLHFTLVAFANCNNTMKLPQVFKVSFQQGFDISYFI